MKIKSLIFTVLETIVKVAILAFAISYIFKGVTLAYDFGYRVFADEPVSPNGGRTITVGISESADVENIAKMLEDKGLIEDAKLFVVQEMLSEYHGKINPGIYDLSTDMTAAQMLQILSTPSEDAEDDVNIENKISSDEGEGSQEDATEGDSAGENMESSEAAAQ